ncbi:uncharacterized protein VTP21DRAFT_2523 [Calcarisporiella thermophila]|uniref:uncharacterized protein n=1 Tax=Calcarisporiella thermophila TaxID=911321 RepID=UPI0037448538
MAAAINSQSQESSPLVARDPSPADDQLPPPPSPSLQPTLDQAEEKQGDGMLTLSEFIKDSGTLPTIDDEKEKEQFDDVRIKELNPSLVGGVAEEENEVEKPRIARGKSSNRLRSKGPYAILRIERDYSRGDYTRFKQFFPSELEGRVSGEQFERTMTTINSILESAEGLAPNCCDNLLACLTIYISSLFLPSHFQRCMRQLSKFIEEENKNVYNPIGINLKDPTLCAFLFIEMELY